MPRRPSKFKDGCHGRPPKPASRTLNRSPHPESGRHQFEASEAALEMRRLIRKDELAIAANIQTRKNNVEKIFALRKNHFAGMRQMGTETSTFAGRLISLQEVYSTDVYADIETGEILALADENNPGAIDPAITGNPGSVALELYIAEDHVAYRNGHPAYQSWECRFLAPVEEDGSRANLENIMGKTAYGLLKWTELSCNRSAFDI